MPTQTQTQSKTAAATATQELHIHRPTRTGQTDTSMDKRPRTPSGRVYKLQLTHRHRHTHTYTHTHTHTATAHTERPRQPTRAMHYPTLHPHTPSSRRFMHHGQMFAPAHAACTYSPPTPTAHTLPSHTHTAHKCCTLACMLDSACLETLRVEQHRRLPGRPTASARRTIFAEIRQRICRAHA